MNFKSWPKKFVACEIMYFKGRYGFELYESFVNNLILLNIYIFLLA